MIPSKIANRYSLESVIGEGGTSIVYSAIDSHTGERVAIKLLRQELIEDERQCKRFDRERKAIDRLDHRHVVAILDNGVTADNVPYLVLEYVQGPSLADVIDRHGALAADRVRTILVQLCDVLATAHSLGILNRDVSPDNILLQRMVDGADCIKLLDFGLSKFTDGAETGTRLTLTGDILGNPMYMSPEQALAQPSDERSDIYSIGTVGWEMLAGEPLFESKTIVGILEKHAHEMPRRPSAVPTDLAIPLQLEQIIMRCLQKKPGDRFSSVSALRTALMGCSLDGPVAQIWAASKMKSDPLVRDLVIAVLVIFAAAVLICLILTKLIGL